MHAAVAACLSCVATVRAETIDLADVIDGETEYVVTDLSGNDSYTYGGAETVDLVFNLSAAADYSGTISGNVRLIKRGTATLTLRSANSYTGGTRLEAGATSIYDLGALGDGKVYIAKGATSPVLWIYAAGDFLNDIETDSSVTANAGYSDRKLSFGENVNLKGTLTGGSTRIWVAQNKTVNFDGEIDITGVLSILPKGNNTTYKANLNARVNATSIRSSSSGNPYGAIVLNYSQMQVNSLYGDYVQIWFGKPDAIPGSVWYFGSTETSRSVFDLRGNSQTIDRVAYNSSSKVWGGSAHRVVSTGSTTARLTMRGTANVSTDMRVENNVSVCWWPEEDYTCTMISNRTWTTTGDLIVSNGTFSLASGSLASMRRAEVGPSATLLVATPTAGALASVTNLQVATDGAFVWGDGSPAPFAEGVTKLTIGEGASVTLPAVETFSVTELWKGGKRLSGGTYTPDGADGTKALPELKQGAVYVPTFAGDTQTLTWTGAAGSDVDTAANWQENEKPDWDSAGAELVFAADGSTSTYAEFGSAATAKKIVFRQPLGFTLGAAAGGSLRLLEGVEFGDTGDVAPTNTVDVPVEIVGDQTWSLPADPGSVFTLSKPLISDENSAVDTLTMTSAVGTLNFFTTNSTYTGNLVAQAKTINIRGENALGLADKGGTVSLTLNHNSNTAKCWFRGCSIDQQLTCTMKISGNNYAIFDCAANTTNIFNGFVYAPNWTQFDAGSHTVFNGGARFYGYTRQRIYDGATIVFRDRLALNSDGGSHTFAPVVGSSSPNPRIVVECPVEMSKSAYYFQIDGGLDLDVRYDRAFSQGCLYLRGRMLLNGNTQRFSSFETSSGTVSSTNAPAFLELDLAANAAQTNSLKFTDLAGFKMVGGGFVRLNGVSTTSGTLAVDGGTVEMGSATWLNASNVVVSGEGELRLTRGGTFDRRKTALSFVDGGKVYVPDGVTLAFASATVTTGGETVEVPADVYDSSNPGPFAGHLSGGGAVRVGKPGALLMLR